MGAPSRRMYWLIYSIRSGRVCAAGAAGGAWGSACTSFPRSSRRIMAPWMSRRGRGTRRRFGFNSRAQLLDECIDLFDVEGFDDGANVGSPFLQAQVQKIAGCNDDRGPRLEDEYIPSQIQTRHGR